ncbi:hypothetical protein CFC21_057459 [Triticum aestivum]|uniref:Uncharacterized protein n=2 Tax=Triticum aestivum TaxID=4565 RepID=A0A9R1GLW9_WHEAT|nr:uncharacterized protein LOC123094748 [Triticum aestivum]XP_044372611.1 uncharacterized protein LOC123094748 [Triticum aestivum]KAF7048766.1 hypothetical protein CFC21_057459 [Triticum aestivum]
MHWHANPNVHGTKSPIRIMDFLSPKLYPNNIAIAIEDSLLVKALKQHEAHSSKFSKPETSTWQQRVNNSFKSATLVIQEPKKAGQQVIFSDGIENDFYQTLVGLLPKLTVSQRIFEIEGVWVDQKTITLSFKPGGWINPRVVGCFPKLKNKDQLNRGRKGLLPNSEIVEHIVSIDDMEKLMNPMLNHSDPANKLILQESNVDFSLLNASLVKMPVFKEKQWILITTNFRAKFFDIMNTYYSGDTFLPTISAVIYNFKVLFAATYGNSTSFNIGNFESRFVAAPKVNFRYDSGIFILQYVSKYKGLELLGFSNDDLQALRQKFLFEIVTCKDNEIQLPLVTSFLQRHGLINIVTFNGSALQDSTQRNTSMGKKFLTDRAIFFFSC